MCSGTSPSLVPRHLFQSGCCTVLLLVVMGVTGSGVDLFGAEEEAVEGARSSGSATRVSTVPHLAGPFSALLWFDANSDMAVAVSRGLQARCRTSDPWFRLAGVSSPFILVVPGSSRLARAVHRFDNVIFEAQNRTRFSTSDRFSVPRPKSVLPSMAKERNGEAQAVENTAATEKEVCWFLF